MIRFLIKRFTMGILVLCSVIVLISSIIYLAPVDPARLTFGQRSDNNTVLLKQKELGLDQPLTTQMVRYLRDLSPMIIIRSSKAEQIKNPIKTLRLGSFNVIFKYPYLRYSYQSGRPVGDLLKSTIPKTLILALAAFVFAAVFGIFFGIIAAISKGKTLDNIILIISTIGISLPSYVAAIFCALLFGFILSPITNLNMQGSIFELNNIGDDVVVWKNLILPALALGVRPISIVTQLSRSAMLEVLNANYINTARSKGLAFSKVIYNHALRNAMNPIITSLSGWLASVLAGAFFVEKVFNYKGVGELTINALISYDIPVILACVLFIASVFIIINILTDIAYTLIDPKVKVA